MPWPRPGGGCRPRPTCWPNSTCWSRWPSWPGSGIYCRPEVVEQPELKIIDGRHPVLDVIEPEGTFVPNDVAAGESEGTILLITGPNMAGKSTYIRQVALITLLAQIGSFVPAREARIGVADRIFARVGASDELARGQSTFMVEMTETARSSTRLRRGAW